MQMVLFEQVLRFLLPHQYNRGELNFVSGADLEKLHLKCFIPQTAATEHTVNNVLGKNYF